jgi:glycosyltransferase involved in cell wall biosynthesis
VRVSLADPVSYTIPYDRSLAEGLARRGHDVDLLCASFLLAELPPPDGYRRHEIFFTRSARFLRGRPRSRLRFALKGAEYPASVRRLRQKLAELDPDILHVQWLGLPRYDLRWLEEATRARPVVFTAHDVLPRRTAEKTELWQRIFATVDRVVVHGEQAVEQLEALGIERERIIRIPHPVFEPPPGQEPGPPSGTTLLFFGLLKASKGLDVILRALPAIAEAVPDVRLVVAGDPLEPVQPLRALAAELGVSERVDWRLGYLPDSDIPALMAAATVVVLPYRKIESSGVLATALGYRRPVVVTDVGSLGSTVREFGAGHVVEPEDPQALAAACVSLLRDPDALARAYEGTERARETLSWDEAAAAHEQLYEEVREARAGRSERNRPTGRG